MQREHIAKPAPQHCIARPQRDFGAQTFGGGMRIVAYEDGYTSQPKPAMVQRICIVRPLGDEEDGHGWPLQGE